MSEGRGKGRRSSAGEAMGTVSAAQGWPVGADTERLGARAGVDVSGLGNVLEGPRRRHDHGVIRVALFRPAPARAIDLQAVSPDNATRAASSDIDERMPQKQRVFVGAARLVKSRSTPGATSPIVCFDCLGTRTASLMLYPAVRSGRLIPSSIDNSQDHSAVPAFGDVNASVNNRVGFASCDSAA